MTPRCALAALLLTRALAQTPAEDPGTKILAEYRSAAQTLSASFVAAMAAANSDKVERLLTADATPTAEDMTAVIQDLDKTLSALARFDLDQEGLAFRTELALRKADPEMLQAFQTASGEPRKLTRRAYTARMGYYRELRELYSWLFTTHGAWTLNRGQFAFRDQAGVQRYQRAIDKMKAFEAERQAALAELRRLQKR